MGSARELYSLAKTRIRDDLGRDPYLLYLLGLAALLSGFWIWHRLPNTATRDEWSRLVDPVVAFRSVVADPGFESLRDGIVWGRAPFGATFYLFGLALIPMLAFAVLTGQLEAITGPPFTDYGFGFYQLWAGIPAWFWTGSLLVVRLFNVAFAVGSVYLTYRIATVIADRATGRLAGLLLTLTFGFLTIAHEGGEDMPALFFLLLALYLLIRYVQSGQHWSFFAASVTGGIAIAFKLTTAPIIGIIAVAHLLRARREGEWPSSLYRPRLLLTGALLGAVTILVGFPTALVGEVGIFAERIFGGPVGRATHQTGPDAPIWWWFLRQYFSGMGLPLFLGSVGATLAVIWRASRRRVSAETVLVAVSLAAFVGLFVPWHDFRVHHLLPTFPLLAILLAGELTRLRRRDGNVGRVVVGALVVTSALYAGVGVAGYADMPRDNAVGWLQENAPEDATLEVYRFHFQDTAVPHGMDVQAIGTLDHRSKSDPCPTYIQLGYRDLLYLKDGTYFRNGPAQNSYFRSLLDGEYGYVIVAEFGPRPPDFVPQRPTPGSLTDLFRHGIVPQTDQYADEQELRPNQYTAILELTGECAQRRNPPF